MLGLTIEKLLIIGLIAAIVIGPERLPHVARRLANLVKAVKRLADTGRERLREDIGDQADAVDWAALDPRRYNPKRIVREALASVFDEHQETPPGAPSIDAHASSTGQSALIHESRHNRSDHERTPLLSTTTTEGE